MLRNSRYLFCTMALLLSAILIAPVQAKPGKGGGKPGGEDPPPTVGVKYEARFITMPNLGKIMLHFSALAANAQGQLVGRYWDETRGQDRAFIYYPNTDAAIDLSELVGITAEDDHWIRNATGINMFGDISAYMEYAATPGLYQAVMIEMSVTPPVIHVLPDSELTDYSIATDINDVGDIVCKYRKADGSSGDYVYNFGTYGEGQGLPLIDLGVSHSVNSWPKITNPTQDHNTRVIGREGNELTTDEQIYRWELGVDGRVTFEDFVDADGNIVHLIGNGINSNGDLCGRASLTYPKKVKGTTSGNRAFVMGETLSSLQTYNLPRGSNGQYPSAIDLNLDHDFISASYMLYHQTEGLLDPLQLLVAEDQDFISNGGYQRFTLTQISERNPATNFPTLVGVVTNEVLNQSLLVVLTPVLSP